MNSLMTLAGGRRLLAAQFTPPAAALFPLSVRPTSRRTRWPVVEVAAVKGDRPSTSGRSGPSTSEQRPRLAKVLAACGVASRRACEELIAEGRVRVNGKVVSEQGTTIDPSADRVEVLQQRPPADGGPAAAAAATATTKAPSASKSAGTKESAATDKRGKQQQQQKQAGGKPGWKVVPVSFFQEADSLYYFAVNKPKGYICSSSDVSGRGKLAVDLLGPWMEQWRRANKDQKRLAPRLFTVGRLDVASSGLLLITNDGQWSNRVIHPSSGLTKEYVVGLEGDASRPQLQALAAGTEVTGTFVSPVEVEVLGDPRRLRIVVQEGKKHEVRELVKAAGLELVSLKRVRIGGFRLPRDLGLGGYRELKPAELRSVTDLAAQEAASASGETRQAVQRQAAAQRAAAAAASVPRALRGMDEEVLERLRRATRE
ncbi:hypothetical protein PLESTF_000675000 [Pleodorina starrii]|nr:hypothetical protein PLESTF_000675000 [Pleodorina starrii]